jgi:hypothetical protein
MGEPASQSVDSVRWADGLPGGMVLLPMVIGSYSPSGTNM